MKNYIIAEIVKEEIWEDEEMIVAAGISQEKYSIIDKTVNMLKEDGATEIRLHINTTKGTVVYEFKNDAGIPESIELSIKGE